VKHQALRQAVIETAIETNLRRLNRGTSGNVSARVEGGFLVTPSGLAYEDCDLADIVAMTMHGDASGRRLPSSEWRFHRDIYAAKEDAGAIVHVHAPFATTLACLERGIPPVHYMVAIAGGPDVPCAPYATFGTQELSDHAVAALAGRKACLLAHHGMIATGTDLGDALRVAEEVEGLAEVYWRALQVAEPRQLDAAEMERVLARFETYGKADK
jgi:L-fuculose-phosphate aldolase